MTVTTFICETYFADGKYINTKEYFNSSEEAIERAKAWRALGHKANAIAFRVDLATCEVTSNPLD